VQEWQIPEVAFLGRSNVGKSSLINALTKTQHLAKTSKSPGRTQQINFFAMFDDSISSMNADEQYLPSDAKMFFVDLPGYGFAKAPPKASGDWLTATREYLKDRDKRVMRRVFLLIDSRQGLQKKDKEMLNWFEKTEIHSSLIITKADKVSKKEIVLATNNLAEYVKEKELSFVNPQINVVSSNKSWGIVELNATLDSFCY
tara:strand:+ start:97 stop:699 length:603 start_codon:yes stop_codon:yes gene_type:complete